jgi:hypothetical protein
MKSTRYPYTMAADLVRSLATKADPELNNLQVPVLSRSHASNIWHTLAQIWGVNEQEVAKKLADHYQETQAA